jgi:uncharacterized membrane protein
MSADVSTLVNTGFIIVRSGSRWAAQFIEEWIAWRHFPGVANEQLGFESLYRSRGEEEMRVKIAILPPHVLNSIAAPMGEQLPHHQVQQ